MEISKKALKRIQQLKTRQRLPKQAGLRLGLKEDSVFLKWDLDGPGDSDLVVMRRDLPIWIDAQTYMHLADYQLDFERVNDRQRFLLRPR
jgi:Fe-S cluster assembly iron-binding protein IscA